VPWIVGGVTGTGEGMAINVADAWQQNLAKRLGYRPVSFWKVTDPFEIPSLLNGRQETPVGGLLKE
jgi:hypothetical protein